MIEMNTLITDKHNQRSTGFPACAHSLERLCCLLFLLTSPLCWGEANTPTRDYKMVDLKNGLTTELLDIGKTSFTFSVKWPLDMEIEMGYLELVGKLDIEERGWCSLKDFHLDPDCKAEDWTAAGPIEINLDQGKATFEALYDAVSWHYMKDMDFSQKAFFAVRVPRHVRIEEGVYLIRGMYEEDDEIDYDEEERAFPIVTPVEWIPAEERTKASALNRETADDRASPPLLAKGEMPKADGAVEGQGEAVSPTGRVWLYASIFLAALCAVFYIVRKRKRT